jgi:hypothetical protein
MRDYWAKQVCIYSIIETMFEWLWEILFGSEKITVQLIPDTSAIQLPGFNSGGLTLIANKGDSVEKIMTNFNTFRGPDSQITKLFTQDGDILPFSTVITQPNIFIVKKI